MSSDKSIYYPKYLKYKKKYLDLNNDLESEGGAPKEKKLEDKIKQLEKELKKTKDKLRAANKELNEWRMGKRKPRE